MTALFADITGFTTLARELDAEELLAVVDPVVAGLADIVNRYGGYIEKFAGDAILALFGAPVAHEDDPIRAIHTALEMHERVAELGEGRAHLALHIGVNTGTVVARSIEAAGRAQYAVLGEPVIVAQRLQSLAAPGETYVGQETMQLTRAHFDFEEVEPRTVKGLPDPLQAYRLASRRAESTRTDTARMFGRDAELAVVLQALSPTSDVSVHITGPAGSGKSRLLAEVRRRMSEAGIACVEMAGMSYLQAAYQCFEPLISAAIKARYPGQLTLTDRLRRLDEDASAPETSLYTSILMGRPVGGQPSEQPPAVWRRLQKAAAEWLRDLSRHRRVVVLVDNYQWLESSSAQLLAHLMSTSANWPVTFCVAGRSVAAATAPHMPVIVELGPLRTADVEDLVAEELGLDPDRRLVEFASQRGQGNPLMIRETVRQLRGEHLIDARAGHAHLVAGVMATSLPATLETLLAARLDTLTPWLADVATAAAAIGFQVPVRLLARVLDSDLDVVQRAVNGLTELGFLQAFSDSDVRFDSFLLREVVDARLTVRRRRALHALVASALESADTKGGSGLVRLAEHHYLAGEYGRALPLLREVARQAHAVFAHDEAIVALDRALAAAEVVDAQVMPELLCDVGNLRMELGEYDRAGQVFDQAKGAANSARAWAGVAAALRRRGDYADGQKSLNEAFLAEPTGDLRLLWCELSWNLSVSGDLSGSLEAARSGLALGHPDDEVAGLLLSQMVRAETLQGKLDTARTHVDQAIRNLEAEQSLTGLCTALRLLGALQERQGNLQEAATTLERGLSLAERTGLVEEIGGCLVNLGMVRGALADHPAAADCYARAETVFERAGHRAGQAVSYGNHAYEVFMMGDSEQGGALGRQGLLLALDVGNHYYAADIHHTLALIAESVGDLATAYHHARSAVTEFDLAGMPDYAQPSREVADRVHLHD